jgi:hypothetical protein
MLLFSGLNIFTLNVSAGSYSIDFESEVTGQQIEVSSWLSSQDHTTGGSAKSEISTFGTARSGTKTFEIYNDNGHILNNWSFNYPVNYNISNFQMYVNAFNFGPSDDMIFSFYNQEDELLIRLKIRHINPSDTLVQYYDYSLDD